LAPGANGLLRLPLALCRQALPIDIFAFLLAIPGHSFVWIFGTKLPIYKLTQKWGLVVYLDQCNPKCIYLQK